MAESTERPNVLYIFSDQQRASAMGCYYGDENLNTSNFDAFANQGIRLDSAVSSTPVCTPYRAMLMTGLYGHHTGVTTNKAWPDLSVHSHIGKSFKSAGYRCGYVGKWHLGEVQLDSGDPMRLGFDDEWFLPLSASHANPNRNYAIDSQQTIEGEGIDKPHIEASRVIEFIQKQDGETPWCLLLSWHPPHPPFSAPESYLEPYLNKELKQHPNTSMTVDEKFRKRLPDMYAQYYGLTEWIDVEFGRIMKALEDSGQADNTIVIYTSDHGEMLCSQGLTGKRWPYRESSQIPFLIRWPERIEAGSSLSMPLGTPDIFPTLCGLAGIDVPSDVDGLDCSASILGGSHVQDRAYLTMHHTFIGWPGWRGVRTDQYNYACTEAGPWILFNVKDDPYEERNLVNENPDLVRELDGLVQDSMSQYGDSWRGVGNEVGDFSKWLGEKQRAQGADAVYPGAERFSGK